MSTQKFIPGTVDPSICRATKLDDGSQTVILDASGADTLIVPGGPFLLLADYFLKFEDIAIRIAAIGRLDDAADLNRRGVEFDPGGAEAGMFSVNIHDVEAHMGKAGVACPAIWVAILADGVISTKVFPARSRAVFTELSVRPTHLSAAELPASQSKLVAKGRPMRSL
jgi:hypothetical protein